MPKTIPWGNEEIPRGISMPETTVRGGYSAFSAGPLIDPTPHEEHIPVMAPGDSKLRIPNSEFQGPFEEMNDSIPSTSGGIIDGYSMTPYGPPYENSPAQDESKFSKLEHKLSHHKGVTNPAGLAAKIGREKLGEKEMARRSAEGRENHKE